MLQCVPCVVESGAHLVGQWILCAVVRASQPAYQIAVCACTSVQVSLLGDDEVTQKVMNHFFCLPVSVQYQSHETYQMFNRVLTAVLMRVS